MKIFKKCLKVNQIIILITIFSTLLSCDFLGDTEKSKIKFMVLCSGGAAQAFSGYAIIDENFTYNFTASGQVGLELEDKKTIYISVTKANVDSAIAIIIYYDDKIVKQSSLDANYPSSTTPTYTLIAQYDIDEEEESTTSSSDDDSSSSK